MKQSQTVTGDSIMANISSDNDISSDDSAKNPNNQPADAKEDIQLKRFTDHLSPIKFMI